MSQFANIAEVVSDDITIMLKNKINNWMKSQPLFGIV